MNISFSFIVSLKFFILSILNLACGPAFNLLQTLASYRISPSGKCKKWKISNLLTNFICTEQLHINFLQPFHLRNNDSRYTYAHLKCLFLDRGKMCQHFSKLYIFSSLKPKFLNPRCETFRELKHDPFIYFYI